MSEHPFAQYVRILGKGRKAARSLNLEESIAAMTMILKGEVKDVQLGAFLMLLRVKEESHEELAGFAQAVRNTLNTTNEPLADIDWPSYAGKREHLSHYILSMLLLSDNGISILSHGALGHTEGRLYTESVFKAFDLNIANSLEDANKHLQKSRLVFLPLRNFCEPLAKIMDLRNEFGLRSPVHSFAKLINPGKCRAMLIPTFHPSYKPVHQQAALLLDEKYIAVFKGDSGEAERRPNAILSVDCLQNGNALTDKWPAMMEINEKQQVAPDIDKLKQVWRGNADNEIQRYAEQAIIGTCALALKTLKPELTQTETLQQAEHFWQTRHKARF